VPNRVVALLLVLGTIGAGCLPAASPTLPPRPSTPARLVLHELQPRQPDGSRPDGARLQAIDPDTLEDLPDLPPLEVPACSSGLSVQPAGQVGAVVLAAGGGPACAQAPSAAVRLLDLRAWTWGADLALPSDAAEPLRLDGPLAWSPDSRWLYLLTATTGEPATRQLWRLDSTASSPPVHVGIDFIPERIDPAPNGSAIFVLGGRSQDGSRAGAAVAGSAFVAIYDPQTLAERLRVPLSGLKLGLPDQPVGSLRPAVAMAPDGSRYYVAHADRPVLDVVDVRAPRLERLERSIALRSANDTMRIAGASAGAWLRASPDGAHLYVWQLASAPEDDLGLQQVDVGSWRVQTLDPIAARLGASLDGQWLFRLDPSYAQRPGVQRARDPAGARLSVLDASGGDEVAVLERDRFSLVVGQYGPQRLYTVEVEPAAPTEADASQDSRRARPAMALVAFAVGSWRELARRSLDGRSWPVTTQAVW